MKIIKFAFWGIVTIALVFVGMANRGIVTLNALPDVLAVPLGASPSVAIPLFVALFIGVGVGLFISVLWGRVREHRISVDGRTRARELSALKSEVDSLKSKKRGSKAKSGAVLERAS